MVVAKENPTARLLRANFVLTKDRKRPYYGHFCVVKYTLGARLRGRTATQRSKKGSEKVLERVLGKGSEKGVCYGFYSKKGF